MIHRNGEEIVFECDGCDETVVTRTSNWPDAQWAFNAEGWKAEKIGDEWTHLCRACRRK